MDAELPDEVLLAILAHLQGTTDMFAVVAVSRQWRRVGFDRSLWRGLSLELHHALFLANVAPEAVDEVSIVGENVRQTVADARKLFQWDTTALGARATSVSIYSQDGEDLVFALALLRGDRVRSLMLSDCNLSLTSVERRAGTFTDVLALAAKEDPMGVRRLTGLKDVRINTGADTDVATTLGAISYFIQLDIPLKSFHHEAVGVHEVATFAPFSLSFPHSTLRSVELNGIAPPRVMSPLFHTDYFPALERLVVGLASERALFGSGIPPLGLRELGLACGQSEPLRHTYPELRRLLVHLTVGLSQLPVIYDPARVPRLESFTIDGVKGTPLPVIHGALTDCLTAISGFPDATLREFNVINYHMGAYRGALEDLPAVAARCGFSVTVTATDHELGIVNHASFRRI